MNQRPNCQAKECTEGAMMLIGNKMLCGAHVIKASKLQEARTNALLEEL